MCRYVISEWFVVIAIVAIISELFVVAVHIVAVVIAVAVHIVAIITAVHILFSIVDRAGFEAKNDAVVVVIMDVVP